MISVLKNTGHILHLSKAEITGEQGYRKRFSVSFFD